MTLDELMDLPYAMILKNNKLMLVELAIQAEVTEDLNKALEEINLRKREYFTQMIEQKSEHLVPVPTIWRKKFFPMESYDIKRTFTKAAIYAGVMGAVLVIVIQSASRALEKNIIKAKEVVDPVVKSEQLKTEIFKKNVEKYRPYIKEIVKVWEEERKK